MTPQVPAPARPRTNPLLTPSPLPFGAPPFDQIQDEDFQPAFEAGMKSELRGNCGHRRQPGRADLREHARRPREDRRSCSAV